MADAQKSKYRSTIIAAIIGLVLAGVVIGIAIGYGFEQASAAGVGSYVVSLCGIDIFTIDQAASSSSGSSADAGVVVICVAFMAVAVIVERIIASLRSR